MPTFRFCSEEIEVGFSERFFASGESSSFSFDPVEYPEGPIPNIRDMRVHWNIKENLNPWSEYEEIQSANRVAITSRAAEIQSLFDSPSGWMWVPEPGILEISLRAPESSGFQSFIVGLATLNTSFEVRCSGIWFAGADQKIAPAPTSESFLREREPLFFRDNPLFRLSQGKN